MTSTMENLLISAFSDEVGQLEPPTGILARAARQHHRRAVRRRVTSVAGIAAATTLIAGVGLTGDPAGRPHPPAAGPAAEPGRTSGPHSTRPATGSPRVRLVAALTATRQTSYALTIRNVSLSQGETSVYADFVGSYDPSTRTGSGFDRLQGGQFEVRLIGDRFYEQTGPNQWVTGTGSFVDVLLMDGGRHWGPSSGTSADPTALFRTIDGLGQITFAGSSGTGAAALDKYRYRYRIAGDDSVVAHDLTGTIEVHHSTNLIARITQTTTVTGAHPEIADRDPLTFTTVMSFSNYGIPVIVQAPPAAQTEPRGQKMTDS